MKRRQDGSILVLALLVSASASIAGMWLVLTSDLGVRRARYLARAADAARLAVAGLQEARVRLGQNPAWDGESLVDPDNPSQSLLLVAEPLGYGRAQVTSTGLTGDAQQALIAQERAVIDGALAFNYFSATTLLFDDCTADGFVRANGNVDSLGNVDFSGVVETVQGYSVTDSIDGAQVAFAAQAMALPAPSFGEYAARASTLVGLPFDDAVGALLLARCALRPDQNPYGATNPEGAYLLDAGGQNVVIRDVFIEGTLIVRNALLVRVERGYHHDRAVPSLATLLVDGDLELRLEASLTEVALVADLNGDLDMLDTFAPEVKGVVHCTGAFIGPFDGMVTGVVTAQTIRITGASAAVEEPILATDPVRGFTVPGAWDVVSGSIERGGA